MSLHETCINYFRINQREENLQVSRQAYAILTYGGKSKAET